MNAKALSEVIAILNVMDSRVLNKIPPNFIKFIKQNRDILYNPKFDKIPENFDNLEHDTKVIFALIYKKYFFDNDKFKNTNFESKEETIQEECKSLVVTKNTVIDRFKKFINYLFNKLRNIK